MSRNASEARLILLHAIHLNLTPYGPANPTWLRAALCREALEKMEGIMARAQRLGVPVISVIEEGMPSKVITDAAKRWKIDLIVLAQKRGRWARLFGQRDKRKISARRGMPGGGHSDRCEGSDRHDGRYLYRDYRRLLCRGGRVCLFLRQNLGGHHGKFNRGNHCGRAVRLPVLRHDPAGEILRRRYAKY